MKIFEMNVVENPESENDSKSLINKLAERTSEEVQLSKKRRSQINKRWFELKSTNRQDLNTDYRQWPTEQLLTKSLLCQEETGRNHPHGVKNVTAEAIQAVKSI